MLVAIEPTLEGLSVVKSERGLLVGKDEESFADLRGGYSIFVTIVSGLGELERGVVAL